MPRGVAQRLKKLLRENGLSLSLAGLFIASLIGHAIAGYGAHREELVEHGRTVPSFGVYLRGGHFLESLFENWESEFLQMGLFVLLAAKLRQKGSAESKHLEGDDAVDEEPSNHRDDPRAPWPVQRGGIALRLYRHSLAFSLLALFAFSFAMHAIEGLRQANEEQRLHGATVQSLGEYVTSSQFWFESLQNWQSEFVAVLALIVLSIFLREQGSSQSKPVAAPHAKTGD
jgi:hypothetical protein